MTTDYEECDPRQRTAFTAPCAFAIVDGEGKIIYVGVSRGGGAVFNPYQLPDKIAYIVGARLRAYHCESYRDALLKRDTLIATYSPDFNRPRGRPKGSRNRPQAGLIPIGRTSVNDNPEDHLTESQRRYGHDPAWMEGYATPDWDKLRADIEKKSGTASICETCEKCENCEIREIRANNESCVEFVPSVPA